jgi:hypothetical protein
MRDHVMYQRIGQRELVEEVFLTGHGADDIHSKSLATTNVSGNNFVQVPAGTVIAKWKADGLHYPIAADAAASAVTSANVIPVSDVLQFLVGDYVEIEGEGFRQITVVDYANDTITVDGAALTLSEGDTIEADRTRSFDLVSTTASAPGGGGPTTVEVDNPGRFEVGDTVSIGSDTGLSVTAVDTGAGTITVDGDIAVDAGDLVVSNRDAGYIITTKTVDTQDYTFTPDNVLVPTRGHGRVREKNVRGLTATARAELAGLIIFDPRQY